jgi:hypothetical protein
LESKIRTRVFSLGKYPDIDRIEILCNFRGRNISRCNHAIIPMSFQQPAPDISRPNNEKFRFGDARTRCKKRVYGKIYAREGPVVAYVSDQKFAFDSEPASQCGHLCGRYGTQARYIGTVGQRYRFQSTLASKLFGQRFGNREHAVDLLAYRSEILANSPKLGRRNYVLRKPIDHIVKGSNSWESFDTEEAIGKQKMSDLKISDYTAKCCAVTLLADRQSRSHSNKFLKQERLPYWNLDDARPIRRFALRSGPESGTRGNTRLL